MEQQILNIKTFFGMEEVLAQELQQLGGAEVEILNRMVQCKGDLGFIYKVNYALSTALRVLVPVLEFRAKNETHLYKNLSRFDWDHYQEVNQTFKIDATVHSDFFPNSHYCELKCKDALVDFFRKKENNRPNVSKKEADIVWNLHIYGDWVTLSLDSSGDSLHRRGYRQETGEAPINEVLAAGVLALSGWDGKGNLLDPMCGSGTFLIEAAFRALRIPPQIKREKFAFQNWKNFDAELWKQIKTTRLDRIQEYHGRLLGYDSDPKAIAAARKNINAAEVQEFIELSPTNFFDSKKEISPLQIVSNPPYNERMEITDADFYSKIGSTLKHHYPDCLASFITADANFPKQIGLRPDKKIKLYNGKLESRLLRYETYAGSKRKSD